MVDRKDVDFESVFAKISPGISDPIYLALGPTGLMEKVRKRWGT
jgi:hypothetical protein